MMQNKWMFQRMLGPRPWPCIGDERVRLQLRWCWGGMRAASLMAMTTLSSMTYAQPAAPASATPPTVEPLMWMASPMPAASPTELAARKRKLEMIKALGLIPKLPVQTAAPAPARSPKKETLIVLPPP
jgi:hypothetical protein